MKIRETIALELIDDNPWQPRVEIEPTTLEILANSIQQVGLLQAPAGRPVLEGDGRIQLAFGHRRVAACKLLHERGDGPGEIEMDLDMYTDEQMAVMALTENVARRRLTQIEVVRAHRRALDETELSIQSLADQLGVSRSALSNNLRVLELPDFVLEHVESGALTVSVAREFLVLQNADHAHTEDMRAVIKSITEGYRVKYEGASPNWTRRNVRKEISERVGKNEQDFRPIGPRIGSMAGSYAAGDVREAAFDVEAFCAELPDTLHTIPARDGDQSRVWTCDVREWRRRQTQASREANKAGAEQGNARPGQDKNASKDQQFEAALAKDPVWIRIRDRRTKKGPNRPLDQEEKAALGTRAEMVDVDAPPPGHIGFWRMLKIGAPEDVHYWEADRSGENLPSYFDTAECRSCVAGAAYAKSRNGYRINGVQLICTNRACYEAKCEGFAAAHRETVLAELAEINARDNRAVAVATVRLAVLSPRDLRTLATSIIAAQPGMSLHHAMGVPHKKWSFKPITVSFVSGLLNHRPAAFDRYGGNNDGALALDLESLDDVPDEDLLELVASLMVHHLREAGRLPDPDEDTPVDDVSQETEQAQPDFIDAVLAERATLSDAIAAVIEPAAIDEYLTYGNLKAALPERFRGEHASRWLPAIAPHAPSAFVKKVKIEGKVVVAVFGIRLKAQASMPETSPPSPDPLAVREMLVGEPAAGEMRPTQVP